MAWRGYNDRQLASYISGFSPTWVTQLIWLSRDKQLTDAHVARWNAIRDACLSRGKCAFVFMLNFNDYVDQPRGAVAAKFAEINAVMGGARPDGWLFDFLGPAIRNHPDTVKEAISASHASGQFIGGNIWGAPVMQGLDYICVVDGGADTSSPPTLQWDENLIQRYHKNHPELPIHFHTADNPQNDPNGHLCLDGHQWFDAIEAACTFKCEYNTEQRKAYVLDRAQRQAQSQVTYEYNLFFPTCPIFRSYDSLGDGDMSSHLASVMNKFNPI